MGMVVLVAGIALGIVLLAFRIVVGWISRPAGVAVDRAIRKAGSVFVQLVIVAAGVGIVALVWVSIRG